MESQSELPEARATRATAKRWYEAAAAQGHKEACLALWGIALQESRRRRAESIPFLLKLAEFGNGDARLVAEFPVVAVQRKLRQTWAQ